MQFFFKETESPASAWLYIELNWVSYSDLYHTIESFLFELRCDASCFSEDRNLNGTWKLHVVLFKWVYWDAKLNQDKSHTWQ